jgi:ABC-type oligopeptide transport system ATPase subunit
MLNLSIKNFGAIKFADIATKKYNIFIGDTSSGKSTAAKLLTIFNSISFWAIGNGGFKSFLKLLEKYNINFEFSNDTKIAFKNNSYIWEISKDEFRTNFQDSDLMKSAQGKDSDVFIREFINKKKTEGETYKRLIDSLTDILNKQNKDKFIADFIKPILISSLYDQWDPIYIPAERILISIFSNSIFSLLSAGANIPECIKDFGSLYEKARLEGDIEIEAVNINVSFSNEEDIVLLKDDEKEIRLTQTSSGMQSIIPLWTVFERNIEKNEKRFIVIEEPELNLFPSSQLKLIENIIGKMRKIRNNTIVITTHSPYILSSIDNLIFGHEILKKAKNKRSGHNAIREVIPSMALIDFEDVSSYYFSNEGHVKNILDDEMKSIGAEYIDGASNETSHIFNKLLEIQYKNEL